MRLPHRCYVDTSVIGGAFDAEFETASNRFFERVRQGRYIAVISSETIRELEDAPEHVVALIDTLPRRLREFLDVDERTWALARAYIKHGVIPRKCESDAVHVAAASIAEVDVIVSWNFRHIVNRTRRMGYTGVNTMMGLRTPDIVSPPELLDG